MERRGGEGIQGKREKALGEKGTEWRRKGVDGKMLLGGGED